MHILVSQYITTTAMKKKKKTWTNYSLLFNASAVCWNMSIYSVITQVLIARAHRWDRNSTRWYLCLKALPVWTFKSQRMRARTRSEKICECAHPKRANPRLRTRANIKLSLKYCVWMDKFTQKLCQNARLGKYPIADIAGWTYCISALDQCILLKWQHFLNINQTATTKKSLTALDWIAFLTLIKINL